MENIIHSQDMSVGRYGCKDISYNIRFAQQEKCQENGGKQTYEKTTGLWDNTAEDILDIVPVNNGINLIFRNF